jgi:hypothetical protein
MGTKHTGVGAGQVDQATVEKLFPRISRRRLIKAGAAAPLVTTLLSRPAWGTYCSFSGDILSGNLSNHDHGCSAGSGCTPGFWKNNLPPWQLTAYSPGTCVQWNNKGECTAVNATTGTSFAGVFGYTSLVAGANSLMEVLQKGPGSSPDNIDYHIVAAVLNATAFPQAYGPSETEIIDAYKKARSGDPDMSIEKVAAVVTFMNERGCPIDAHGDCMPFPKVVYTDGNCYCNVPAALDNLNCVPVFTTEVLAKNKCNC